VSKSKQRPIVSSLWDSMHDLAKRDPDTFVMLYFQATALVVELDRAGYEYLAAGVLVKKFRVDRLQPFQRNLNVFAIEL
jgi:hypothetical protein